MKKTLTSIALILGLTLSAGAQLQTPKASPLAKLEQRVGLTDIKIEYSRPGKNNRTVFGDVVPFNEVWRTGANENTKITTSDALIFGKDTLKPGTYAIFTKPAADSWELIFYADATNWGTPEKWEETKVVLRTKAMVTVLPSVVETFTISLDNLENESASLNFTWDKTTVSFPFSLLTAQRTLANIKKVMAGPSAGDYYGAATYYYTNKIDLKQALEWVDKAIAGNPTAFYMYRTKANIQKELGDKKGAKETAKAGLIVAEKANNKGYIQILTALIEEYSK
jgi:hypothetical protein